MRSKYSVSTTRLARTMAIAALTFSSLVGGKLVVAAPITVGANFSGSPQNFNSTLTASGTSSLVGSGTITFNPSGSFPPTFSLPFTVNQTNLPLTLAGGSVALVSDPIANNTLGFDDLTLANKNIAGTNADFKNGATWAFAFNPVNITFNVSIGGLSVPVNAIMNANGTISNYSFTQDPGTSQANLGPGSDYALPGTFNSGLAGNVSATVSGNSVLNSPYSTPSTGAGVVSGTMSLSDAEPLNPFPHDVFAQLDGPLPTLSIPFAFSQTAIGTAPNPPNGQTAITAFNYTFGVNFNVNLNNSSYHLETTLPNALVPEPSAISLCLLSLAALGLLCGKLRRKNF